MPTTSNASNPHPSWCEPRHCTAGEADVHPAAPPPAHRGRLHSCDPGPGSYVTGLATQLVQFTGSPAPVTFLQLRFSDVDSRQSFYLYPDQAHTLARVVATLLALPDDDPSHTVTAPQRPAGHASRHAP